MTGQVIRGFVFENATHKPVDQASIFIHGSGGTTQLHTDARGAFLFIAPQPGRYDVIVSHVSYELVHLQALQVSSTKDLILDIPLTARVRELTEVNIMAPSVRRVMNRFYVTTEEETRRFPGTFFDPARTATLFPGVYATNDQANALVIHGLSPMLMQWYLEGVPILNPNHLSNAGTLSDRSSATAGGVNMLSNQVLATTNLATGALHPRLGDAVSGVMEMQFRPGNVQQPEYTVQAGLLGIDVASEGRLLYNHNISYLVNYRYSTIGLLSALGVNFGDERIQFQDLNFNLHMPLNKPGAFVRVFGVGGLNSNDLDGPKPPDEREDVRDISQVEYGAGAVVSGATFQWPMRRGVLRLTSAISYTRSVRDEHRLSIEPELIPYSDEITKETRLSHRIDWQGQRANRMTLNAGALITSYWIDQQGMYPQSGPIRAEGATGLVRPYAQFSYVLTGDLVLRGGMALAMISGHNEVMERNSKLIPEPALHLYWQPGDKLSIESGLRYTSMLLSQYTLRHDAQISHIDALRASTFSFIVRHQVRHNTQIAGIINRHVLRHVPADPDSMRSYTVLGDIGVPHSGPLAWTGRGSAMSLSLGIRQDLQGGTFVRAGFGWTRGTHTGSFGAAYSTPFDSGPWCVVAGGKEWNSDREFGPRTFGANGSLHLRGGMRDQEIDLDKSRDAGYTVYDEEGDYGIKQGSYFRIDLRLYLRKEKAHKTTTWSLDVQNALSRENPFFSLYDPLQDAVRQTFQLGIIPVLSYRVDF